MKRTCEPFPHPRGHLSFYNPLHAATWLRVYGNITSVVSKKCYFTEVLVLPSLPNIKCGGCVLYVPRGAGSPRSLVLSACWPVADLCNNLHLLKKDASLMRDKSMPPRRTWTLKGSLVLLFHIKPIWIVFQMYECFKEMKRH